MLGFNFTIRGRNTLLVAAPPVVAFFIALLAGHLSGEPALAQASDSVSPAPATTDAFKLSRLDTRHRLEADGRGTVTMENEILIQHRSANQQLGQLQIPYVRGVTELEIETIEVIRPDGTSTAADRALFQDRPAPIADQYPIYSDLRAVHVTVPPFQPGDRIFSRIKSRIVDPIISSHLQVVHTFNAMAENETLVVDIPLGLDPHRRQPPGMEPEIEQQGDREVLRWTASRGDIAEVEIEDLMTGKLVSHVEVSSFRDWTEVGDWFRGLYEPQLELSPELRALAERLTSGLDSDAAKVGAIYAHVATEIRYLGLAFGQSRYRPRAPDEVLRTGFGDCKDKHTLTATLLRAVGIEATPVLVSASNATPLDVPTPVLFDHLITQARSGDREWWLDTTEISPVGYLPPTLRGKQGLWIGAEQTSLVTLPEELPSVTLERLRVDARLDSARRLAGSASLELSGDMAQLLRQQLLSFPAKAQEESVQMLFQTGLPGASIGAVEIPDPMRVSETLLYRAEFTVEDAVSGSPATLDIPWTDLTLPELTEDGSGLWFAAGQLVDYEVRVELPAGSAAQLPIGIELDSGVATYRSHYEIVGRTLVARRELRAASAELEPDHRAYAAFRKAAIKDLGQEVVISGLSESETQTSTSVRDLLKQARELAKAGDYEQARQLTTQARDRDLEAAWPWEALGHIELRAQRYPQAVEAYSTAAQLDPFDTSIHYGLAWAHQAANEDEAAIAAYRKLLQIDPLHAEGRTALGVILAEDQACAEAIPLLRLAPGQEQGNHRRAAALGVCLLRQGQQSEGETELRRLLAANPGPNVLAMGAWHASDLEHWPLAIDLYRAVLKLDPEDDDARLELAVALAQAGQLEAALPLAERHLESHQDDQRALALVTGIHVQNEDWDRSMPLMRRLLDSRPEDVPTALTLADLMVRKDAYGDARAVLEKTLPHHPEHPEINRFLGTIAAREGRHADAVRHLEIAASGSPSPFVDQDLLDYARSQLP